MLNGSVIVFCASAAGTPGLSGNPSVATPEPAFTSRLQLFSDTLKEMLQSALLALGMTAVLLFIDPVLALLSLSTAPILVVISWIFRRRVRDRARKQRRHEGDLASVANEALSAMAVVKAFGAEEMESERVRSRSEQRMGAGVEVARLQAQFDGTVGVLRAFATAIVTVVRRHPRVEGRAVGRRPDRVRQLHAQGVEPAAQLRARGDEAGAAMARAERIAELLSTDEVIEERPHAYHGPRAQGDIAIEHVSFAYSGERPALEDVSVEIPAGKRLALTGPSGAGKSTLSALIARFYDPTEGRVLIDGRDARDCSLAWLRDQVAVVLQDTVLFTGSVRENIAYGVDATDEEIVDAAKAAAAHEFIRRLPDGYDTQLGPQGVGLSGGQRQRIGIARTLLRNPPIIILDEPTTALDRESEAQVLEGLDRLMRGRTCILITHSPRLVRTADLSIELDGGRVVRDRDARTAGAAVRAAARPRRGARDPRALARPRRAARRHRRRARLLPAGRPDARALPRGRRRRRARRPGEEKRALAARLLRRRRGRHDHVAAVRPAAAGAGRAPGRARAQARSRPRRRADPDPLQAAGARRPALGRARAEGLRQPRRRSTSALTGLRADSPLRTAAFEAALPDLRLTMQRRVHGTGPSSASGIAGEAGEAVARLQRAALEICRSRRPSASSRRRRTRRR